MFLACDLASSEGSAPFEIAVWVDEVAISVNMATLPTDDEQNQILGTTVPHLSLRRRGGMEKPTGRKQSRLAVNLDFGRSGMHEVQLVLLIVVVQEALVARRHDDGVDAERLDSHALPDLPKPVAVAELGQR